MNHTVFLAFGSNLGNRRENIERALELLRQEGLKPVSVSQPVATAPEGFASANEFLNSAARFTTALSPHEALEVTQRTERILGRTQKSEGGIYHDRTIDIDILFYDDIVLNTPELSIPHPRMAERMFVLSPMNEIAPALRHPANGKTIHELYMEAKQGKR